MGCEIKSSIGMTPECDEDRRRHEVISFIDYAKWRNIPPDEVAAITQEWLKLWPAATQFLLESYGIDDGDVDDGEKKRGK